VIACLYDVHGNLPALEAVLDDARAQGARAHLLGGDYALFGGWPAEVLAVLRALPEATWIRGNVDRWMSDPAAAPQEEFFQSAIADSRAAIGDPSAEALGDLPESVHIGTALAVHASPRSDMESFMPEPAPEEAALLEGVEAPRLIFGHTHLPFRRISVHGGIELVNPGSVGLPLDGDRRAAYAILHDDGRVEHRRVEYDHAAAVARLGDAFGDAPWVPVITGRMEAARLDAS
jgi:predicted phosphodiesterase